jgi:hypothetical protein
MRKNLGLTRGPGYPLQFLANRGLEAADLHNKSETGC